MYLFKNENDSFNYSREISLNNSLIGNEILNKISISYKFIIFAIVFVVIFLFGIFTNILVIVIYLFNKKIKNHSNYFFANLSVSDILVLSVCIPIAITDSMSPEWQFGFIYCMLYYIFKLITF